MYSAGSACPMHEMGHTRTRTRKHTSGTESTSVKAPLGSERWKTRGRVWARLTCRIDVAQAELRRARYHDADCLPPDAAKAIYADADSGWCRDLGGLHHGIAPLSPNCT